MAFHVRLTDLSFTALQVPCPEQPGETDLGPQGLRYPGSGRHLLLPGLLQHRWPLPR